MDTTLIEKLAEQIQQDEGFVSPMIGNESQTRNSLINEMLKALGYDISDPKVCIVESNAGYKKQGGEKVDYSLSKEGELVLILEAKSFETNLENCIRQLSGYFGNLKREEQKFFAVLSNGVQYQFFADLNKENILDEKPFFVFNLQDYSSEDLETLKMFDYEKIDCQKIWEWAKLIKNIKNEISHPSSDFVKLVTKKIIEQKITKNIAEQYAPKIIEAFAYLFKNRHDKIEDKSKEKSTHAQKTNPHLAQKHPKKGSVNAFWEEAIISILSKSSTPLTAEEIWEKIQKNYPKQEIPTSHQKPVKRISEKCAYEIENVDRVGKNPSKYFLKNNNWTEEETLKNCNDDMIKIYQSIKAEILQLKDVSINPTKNYISFKVNNKNFVGFRFQKSKIRAFFTPSVSEFDDPSKKLIDTYEKNTGNGRTEFYYQTPQDKDYLLSLIKQSYAMQK